MYEDRPFKDKFRSLGAVEGVEAFRLWEDIDEGCVRHTAGIYLWDEEEGWHRLTIGYEANALKTSRREHRARAAELAAHVDSGEQFTQLATAIFDFLHRDG